MKRKLLTIFVVLTLLLSLSVSVYADMGPKPSVRISFEHLPKGQVYGTLLSEYDHYGPTTAPTGAGRRAITATGTAMTPSGRPSPRTKTLTASIFCRNGGTVPSARWSGPIMPPILLRCCSISPTPGSIW